MKRLCRKSLCYLLAAVFMISPLYGCNSKKEDYADTVFKNGIIQTMVSEDDVAEAVAIKGEEVTFVGSDKDVESFIGPDTEVIDLDGKMMTPGFMDGHIHAMSMWTTRLYEIDLTGLTTNEEYLEKIKEFVDSNPDLDVYTVGSFMLNAYMEEDGSNPGPQKEDLDAISSDKPIIVSDTSHHSIWVNSKALEMAGITKDTANPTGGIIHKNSDGEPTGYLTDSAGTLVNDAVPDLEYTEEMYENALDEMQKEANSMGITGLTHIVGLTSTTPDAVKAFGTYDKKDKLTLRMRLINTATPDMEYEDIISTLNDFAEYDSDMLKSGTVKLFYDGVTESGTAVMRKPYLRAAGQGDNWYGEPVWNTADFEEVVKNLDADGYQIHVHAIGDGAVNGTLNAFEAAQEANGEHDARFTMTHVCAISDEDIQRNADLKIINAMQFLWMYSDSLYDLEAAYIGEDDALGMYPTKNMIEAGCIISGASDAPITPYDVLDEIEVGVTRNSPYEGEEDTDMYRWADQALTPYQLLEAYTKNVAYENFMDDQIGTIEVGKKADLVVLGQNILEIDPKLISDTEIVYTISNGKIVYSS